MNRVGPKEILRGKEIVKEINHDRRRFLAAAIVASAKFGIIGSSAAQFNRANPATVSPIKPGTNEVTQRMVK